MWRAFHYILLIFHWFVLSFSLSLIHSFPIQCSFPIPFSCFDRMIAATTIYFCIRTEWQQSQTNGIVMRIVGNDFFCKIGKLFYCSCSISYVHIALNQTHRQRECKKISWNSRKFYLRFASVWYTFSTRYCFYIAVEMLTPNNTSTWQCGWLNWWNQWIQNVRPDRI